MGFSPLFGVETGRLTEKMPGALPPLTHVSVPSRWNCTSSPLLLFVSTCSVPSAACVIVGPFPCARSATPLTTLQPHGEMDSAASGLMKRLFTLTLALQFPSAAPVGAQDTASAQSCHKVLVILHHMSLKHQGQWDVLRVRKAAKRL